MSDDLRQRFVTLMEEVFNRGNDDAADDLVAERFVNHESPDNPGREGFKTTARWLRAQFPDYHAELHETVVQRDLIAARLTASGTYQGDYLGPGPTGRSFSVQHIHLYRVDDTGQVVEHWACRDDLGQLRQLGVIPSTGG